MIAIAGISAAVLIGAILLVMGIRGRVMGVSPHCAKCGFDLSGVTGEGGVLRVESCSECGTDVRPAGAIRLGKRARRTGLILGGGVLLGLAGIALGTAIWVGTAGNQIYAKLPTWTLAWLIDSGTPAQTAAAANELMSRDAAGTLSNSQITAIEGRILARHGDWNRVWIDELGQFIEKRIQAGTCAAATRTAYYQGVLKIDVQTRPEIAIGDPVPYELVLRYRTGNAGMTKYAGYITELRLGETRIDGDRQSFSCAPDRMLFGSTSQDIRRIDVAMFGFLEDSFGGEISSFPALNAAVGPTGPTTLNLDAYVVVHPQSPARPGRGHSMSHGAPSLAKPEREPERIDRDLRGVAAGSGLGTLAIGVKPRYERSNDNAKRSEEAHIVRFACQTPVHVFAAETPTAPSAEPTSNDANVRGSVKGWIGNAYPQTYPTPQWPDVPRFEFELSTGQLNVSLAHEIYAVQGEREQLIGQVIQDRASPEGVPVGVNCRMIVPMFGRDLGRIDIVMRPSVELAKQLVRPTPRYKGEIWFYDVQLPDTTEHTNTVYPRPGEMIGQAPRNGR